MEPRGGVILLKNSPAPPGWLWDYAASSSPVGIMEAILVSYKVLQKILRSVQRIEGLRCSLQDMGAGRSGASVLGVSQRVYRDAQW